MILFDLKCGQNHVFEAWFDSSSAWEDQRARGLVSCPICDDSQVEKAVMAPAVGPKSNMSVVSDHQRKDQLEKLLRWQRDLESRSDYVGASFVEEARRRAESGEDSSERGIIGEASLEDAMELMEDGIAVAPLPFRIRQQSDA